MRYSQLRAFHHVAVSGGFSHAARALNQTQPSISDHVRRLEESHDTLLFHRDTRHVQLTDAGQALFRLTMRFFEVEDEIATFFDENRAAPAGQLRIIADSAVHVTSAIGRFRVAYPDVAVSLQTGNSEDVIARLRDYDAEIGIVGNLEAAPDVDRIDLGETPIVAIAAHGLMPGNVSALDLSDLARWPLVFRETGSRTRMRLEHAAKEQGVHLSPAIEVEGREAMREVVASGAGVGFLSEAEFGHDMRLRKLHLNASGLAMSEALVTLAVRRDVPVIRAFLKTVT